MGLGERKDKGILVFTAAKRTVRGGAKERVCTKENILKE